MESERDGSRRKAREGMRRTAAKVLLEAHDDRH
jgi:hypothetical protein